MQFPDTPVAITLTALPPPVTATRIAPTALPTIAGIPQTIPDNPLTRAFALSTFNSVVSGSGFLLPFAANAFARNPVDPNRYAVVDTRGLIYLFNGAPNDANIVRLRTSPFVDFEPNLLETNNAAVVQVAWSPDGRYLAFLVDTERDGSSDNDSYNDGVWVLEAPQPQQIGAAQQVFRECPLVFNPDSCLVDFHGNPNVYNSRRFEWNNRSDSILIELDLPQESRRAFTVVGTGGTMTRLSDIYRYDYASWSWDGSRVLASGGGEDGRVGLRWITPGNPVSEPIASPDGLWLQNAVERPNGQIVALGSVGGAGTPMRLYDSSGTALTAEIGFAAPEQVDWSPDRSAALVVISDIAANPVSPPRRYYVAEINGAVREITAAVAGALAVQWVGGIPPATTDTGAPAGTRAAVSIQSQYGINVNQQVQVVAPAGVILRAEPSLGSDELALLNAFEYVVVIGGPVQAEGLIWWQVQNRTGQIGWAAEASGGVQLLSIEPL